ncbi:MAG: MFS transporter [Chloroflexota bacterium]
MNKLRQRLAILRSALSTARSQPTLLAVTAEGFVTRLGFSMVGFALPLFALSLGMGVAEIGLLYALRTVTVILVKPLMGWAADRFGRKRTLVFAVALRCFLGLLFVFASEPWHLYAIRILHGMMSAAREPAATALIADHGDRKTMASSFAWYSTARDLGRSLGFAAAGLIIVLDQGYRGVFLVAFGTSCVALVTVIRYVRERPSGLPIPVPATMRSAPAVSPAPLYRGVVGYFGFGLMVATSAEMMVGLYPVLATQYAHLTEAQAGLAASASSVAILVAGPLFGWISDNIGRGVGLMSRSAANCAASLLYLAFPSFEGFTLARVVDDSGKAAFRPTWGAMLAEISESSPSHRTRLMSFVDSSYSVGEVIGPLLAGLLLGAFGFPAMLGVRAALAVVTEIYALRVLRHVHQPGASAAASVAAATGAR